MARLFSINFRFQNEEHTALVNIRKKGSDTQCEIRYTDWQLNDLLCGKQFVFSLLEGLQQPAGKTSETVNHLLAVTLAALKIQLVLKSLSA